MADGCGEAAWGHTSSLMALIANVNRSSKSQKQYKAEDFNPFSRSRKGEQVIVVEDAESKKLFKEAFEGFRK